MFEDFNSSAREVVIFAQKEAKKLNNMHIGTEHLVLGLLRETNGVGARALDDLGVSLDSVTRQIIEIVGIGPYQPVGHIPFTLRAKEVLILARREALQLGHTYIGTAHLLLAVIRDGESEGAKVLANLVGDLGVIRQKVVRLLADPATVDDVIDPIEVLEIALTYRDRRGQVRRFVFPTQERPEATSHDDYSDIDGKD